MKTYDTGKGKNNDEMHIQDKGTKLVGPRYIRQVNGVNWRDIT